MRAENQATPELPEGQRVFDIPSLLSIIGLHMFSYKYDFSPSYSEIHLQLFEDFVRSGRLTLFGIIDKFNHF